MKFTGENRTPRSGSTVKFADEMARPAGAQQRHLCVATILGTANLRGANFANARLWKTILHSVNLAEAILSGADLRKADLRGANLRGADLHHANLDGATISGAIMTRQQFLSIEGEPQDAAVWRTSDSDE